MGSLRRGLILASFPLPAWAEMCAALRPDWTGTPATAWTEALHLFTTVPSVALLVLTALAFRLRNQWLALAVVVTWTVYASILAFADPTGNTERAMIEGCVGSASVFIAAIAALSLGLIYWTAPRSGST